MHNLGRRGAAAFRNEMTIASPSRVMEDIARWIPAGAAQGVDKASAVFERSMRELAMSGANQFSGYVSQHKALSDGLFRSDLLSAYEIGFDLSDIADVLYAPRRVVPSGVGGVMRHTQVNLGGVSISLSAPAGTDLETLARMVGDAINEEAIRLAVAYG